jgi:N-acetyl-gamma-glutamyl-phosphate reductase
MTRNAKKRAGILGASGYIGAELMRYLSVHPSVELAFATANRDAGKRVADVFPNLGGFVPLRFASAEEGEKMASGVDVVFLALPHGESQDVLGRLTRAEDGPLWIDLAGDFRTPDPAGFRKYYGDEHRAPELLERFVYGFTEAQRDKVSGARFIANPGCFATGLLLAVYPLLDTGLLEDPICMTALTGSSGSGREPGRTTHHPERVGNLRAYKILSHQHLLEVEWFLGSRSSAPVRIQFVPQSAPVARGIFATLFLPGKPVARVRAAFDRAYGDEPLVDVIDGSPDLRTVQGTPRSVIGVAGDDERGTVVFSAIDNLGKGAASQAIQNMNCAMGIPETEGLRLPGGFV